MAPFEALGLALAHTGVGQHEEERKRGLASAAARSRSRRTVSISGGITSILVTAGSKTSEDTLRSAFSLRTAYLHAPDKTQ